MNPTWRNLHKTRVPREALQDAKLVEHLKKFTKAPTLSPNEVDFSPGEAKMVGLQRTVQKRKGSFWQLPRDLKDNKN